MTSVGHNERTMKTALLVSVLCWMSSVAAMAAFSLSPSASSAHVTPLASSAPLSQAPQESEEAQGSQESQPLPDREAVARGRKVFLENCTACHGQDATGGSDANTDLTHSQVVKDDVEGKQFGEFLADGRPDLRMPGFALESKSVKDLAAYLHSISVLKAKAATRAQPKSEPPASHP
jgi:mono/diheme cytochrome c family protein